MFVKSNFSGFGHVSDILRKYSSNLPNGDSVAIAEISFKGEYLLWEQEGNQHATLLKAIPGTDPQFYHSITMLPFVILWFYPYIGPTCWLFKVFVKYPVTVAL